MTPADTVNFTGNLFAICAERPHIVIDFTAMAGKEYILYNDLGGPYPGGDPINDFYAGNPMTPNAVYGSSPDTRNFLKIKVGAAVTTPTPSPNPVAIATALESMPRTGIEAFLAAPVTYANQAAYLAAGKPPLTLNAGVIVNKTRNLTLNENFDEWGRLRQLVGTTTVRPGGTGFGRLYLDPATEISTQGQTEVWNIFNLTADSHPMHFHAVNVQILKRQPFRVVAGRFLATGVARGPELDEMGYKETCKMNPGECITVAFKVQLPTVPFTVPASKRTGNNEYVWHCHILEHEEHDMMRPFIII
jgi:spore coat protein A